MAVGLPKIEVIFKGKADTAIKRSAKGVASIIISGKEGNNNTKNFFTYTSLKELEENEFDTEEVEVIKTIFKSEISLLNIIRIATTEQFADIEKKIPKNTNWVAYINKEENEQKKLCEYVKLENKDKTKARKIKAIVYNVSEVDTDDMHIVNFKNTEVTTKKNEKIEGHLYLGRLLGILASAPFDRSVTNMLLSELKETSVIERIDESINKGNFILVNKDDGVRIGRGINTLQTLKDGQIEEMKFISIVETMDIIREDITKSFDNAYLGKYKNSYDNQILLINSINSYFETLETLDILDPNFKNISKVDVEMQRQKWLDIGKLDAKNWDELTVKNNTFSTEVLLIANIKILNAIEDLTFTINI